MADPAPYFTAVALKEARPRLAEFADEVLEARVRQFEEIAERARGVAFTPRERTVLARPWRCGPWWRLLNRAVRTIDEVTVDGVIVVVATPRIEADQLGDLTDLGYVVSGRPTVTYTHGLDEPPQVILDACAEYVEALTAARNSGVSRNVLSQAVDGATTRYSTPSWPDGRYTGWLEVDRLINSAEDWRPQGLG